ncbi:MAG: helix-turn-helix transcriptional regulator [Proteobacteria bacterium]|nr:helix-turn-helix transcriptional regulator [Pseudomonadota bacterium]
MKDDFECCPYYHHAIEVIGRRWAGVIIQALLAGATRFGDLEAAVPDISSRMLSQRLKELETEAIIERTVIPDKPVRIEYRLTEKGRALGPVVESLSAWANDWVECEEEKKKETGGE